MGWSASAGLMSVNPPLLLACDVLSSDCAYLLRSIFFLGVSWKGKGMHPPIFLNPSTPRVHFSPLTLIPCIRGWNAPSRISPFVFFFNFNSCAGTSSFCWKNGRLFAHCSAWSSSKRWRLPVRRTDSSHVYIHLVGRVLIMAWELSCNQFWCMAGWSQFSRSLLLREDSLGAF